MKIWNTKCALTEGILVHDAEDCGDGMVAYRAGGSFTSKSLLHGEGREWRRTRESAISRAEVDFEKTPE